MTAMVKILFFRMTDDVWSSKMMADGEDTLKGSIRATREGEGVNRR
jgi:hypothetical protein